MADAVISTRQVQVTWPTSSVTKAVSADTREVSEVYTPGDDVVSITVQCKATTGSTAPASDDRVYMLMKTTSGDPDADPDTTDEYDTEPQVDGEFGGCTELMVLDCSKGETDSGSGKMMIKSRFGIPAVFQDAYFIADGKATDAGTGTTNTITVSIEITEHYLIAQ